MKQIVFKFLVLALLLFATSALSHPGSGIVVDRQGNVYFIDTGAGIWKIDKQGILTFVSRPAYHWLAIDIDDRLANVTLPYFSSDDATVTRVGNNPTLLASSDFPLTVGTDGSLYYVWVSSSQQVQIYRLAPSGKTTVVKTVPPVRDKKGDLRWRNGITISPDGFIYYSEDKAIRKITPRGELSTVISSLSLPDCGSVEGIESELGAYCRGLAVDTAGNVYVAATGCRAVLKITPDKKIMTVLQASSPWSPTAVALSGKDLYVLEYLHTANESRRDWIPRVRKVSSDGNVVTIATVER